MITLELLMASAIAVLTAGGIYMALRGRTFQVVLGLTLLSYAVNLFLFASGRLKVNVVTPASVWTRMSLMKDTWLSLRQRSGRRG